MGKPAVPDLVPVAQQQGELNKQTAFDIANANRYSQYGPAGDSNVWSTDPNTGAVSNTTTMGQRPQAYYDALMGTGTTATNAFAQKYYGGGGSPTSGGATGGLGALPSYMMAGGENKSSPVGVGIQKDLDYSKLSAMPGSDIGLARQQAQDALYGRSAGDAHPFIEPGARPRYAGV
jgi:hypothetical protein